MRMPNLSNSNPFLYYSSDAAWLEKFVQDTRIFALLIDLLEKMLQIASNNRVNTHFFINFLRLKNMI